MERPGEARHLRDHAQSKDVGRGALELLGRVGLRAQAARRERRDRQRFCHPSVQERSGARFGRARRDHHVRRARHRRRRGGMGERRAPGRTRPRTREVSNRRALDEHSRRAAGCRRRQSRRLERDTGRRASLRSIPLLTAGAGDRSAPLSSARGWRRSRRNTRQRLRTSSWSPSIESSAAGRRRKRRTSPTAACSTRSTSRANKRSPWQSRCDSGASCPASGSRSASRCSTCA